MTRLRKAIAWLLGVGMSAGAVVAIVESRGVDHDTAVSEVAAVRSALSGTWAERVLVVVPLAQAAAANADVALLICGPEPDAGDSAWTDCVSANSTSFDTERYCRVADGVEVARGMEIRLTPEMWGRVRDERDQSINYTVRRGNFDKKAELAAANLAACQGEP
ncbi:MAG: hypothetical protein VW405_01610 [Rhodospirillaceae bacterium]